METKFTEEEWIARDNGSYWEVKRKGEIVGDICAVFECVQKPYITEENQKANAKLIAAAPQMYRIIERALSISDLWTYLDDVAGEFEGEAIALQSMKREFESAIKKATE